LLPLASHRHSLRQQEQRSLPACCGRASLRCVEAASTWARYSLRDARCALGFAS